MCAFGAFGGVFSGDISDGQQYGMAELIFRVKECNYA
jgi:hypothetical protein